MRAFTVSITAAGIIAIAAAAHAAMGYHIKCRAKNCGYETNVTLGPLRAAEHVTGYCRNCKKFVELSWLRTTKQPTKPIGQVWDSKTGRILTIYACPDCKGPFAEIKSVGEGKDELKYCPACGAPDFGADITRPSRAVD